MFYTVGPWIRPLKAGESLDIGWWLSAVAGFAVAAGVAVLWVIARRYRSLSSPAVQATEVTLAFPGLLVIAWLEFWHAQYLRELSSPLWAGLLGYGTVSLAWTTVYFLLAGPIGTVFGQAGEGSAEIAARIRFPGVAGSSAWRRGRLVAVNATVTWLPRQNGAAEVDLTDPCRSLDTIPLYGRDYRRRPTALVTADGPAELDVTPRMITALLRDAGIPPGIG